MRNDIVGLDIFSSDGIKSFYISYISFSRMRAFFVLHYGETLYCVYDIILKNSGYCEDNVWFDLCNKIGDLSILISHSDCDGELTSNECKKLRKCLFVDEEKILSLSYRNEEYRKRMIDQMYEFIDIIEYCADNNEIKLIFG